MSVSVQDILQMMQQQGTPPPPTPDDPTVRKQRMLSMLGVLSGDPALTNFGKTSLEEQDRQDAMTQRNQQEAYQRQQDSIQKNIELARLGQGADEQNMNRQLRRDALAQSLKEFNERQQATKDAADAALLGPEDLDVAAHDVMVDPTHIRTYAAGNSKEAQAVRKQIIGRQSQIMADAGLTGADLPGLRANAKAQAGSTQELVKQQNAIAAYADPEVQNFQRLNELAKKVDATGVPLLERFLRPGRAAMGDPDAAEFQSLLTSTRTGAARLLNNPALNGVLSDSARDEMKSVIDGGGSPDQIMRVLNRVTLEIGNRRAAIQNQIGQAGAQMRNLSNASNVPGSLAGSGGDTNPAASPTIAPPGPKRIKVDAMGNPIGN